MSHSANHDARDSWLLKNCDGDRLCRHRFDRSLTVRTDHTPRSRKNHAERFNDLSSRTQRTAWPVETHLLPDGDRRRKAVDPVHSRAFDAIQKLPRGRRERFDITPLTFRIECVKCQTALPGTAHSTNHGQRVVPDLQVNIPKIIDAHAFEFDKSSDRHNSACEFRSL